jgi:hypothetical protein
MELEEPATTRKNGGDCRDNCCPTSSSATSTKMFYMYIGGRGGAPLVDSHHYLFQVRLLCCGTLEANNARSSSRIQHGVCAYEYDTVPEAW